MSNITMKDLLPFFASYLAKYGEKCTLSVDVMEEIMGTSDSEEAMLAAMHEAMTSSDEKDDRSQHDDSNESDMPQTSDAYDYADKMDPEMVAALETNAKAALEGKRGGAVIARNLIRLHGEDTIVNVWPVPGSEGEAGTKYIGNRLADYYKTIIHKDDGTSATGERSWYRDYLERSPAATETMLKLKSIKAVTANEQAPYILPEHEAVRGDKIKIKSKRSAIEGDLTNKKNALVRAVNLLQRMAFLNTKTDFQCEIMLEPAMDANGVAVMEGDKPKMVPVASNKLIQVWDKKDPRTGNVLTIGQLLALKVVEGGTYSAITGTTKRKAKAGTGPAVQNIKIETVAQYDDGIAAFAVFFTKLVDDAKATNALLTHLNAAGSDDLILSMNTVMTGIDAYLSKPGISKRLSDLLAEGTAPKAKAKAA